MTQGTSTDNAFAARVLSLFLTLALITGLTVAGCKDRGSEGNNDNAGKKTALLPEARQAASADLNTSLENPAVSAPDPSEVVPPLSTGMIEALSAELPELAAHRDAILAAEREAIKGAIEAFRSKRKATTNLNLDKKRSEVTAALEKRLVMLPRGYDLRPGSFSLIPSAEAADQSYSDMGFGGVQEMVIGHNLGMFLGPAITELDVPAGGGKTSIPIESGGRVTAEITISAQPGSPPTAELTTQLQIPLFLLDAFSKVSFSGSSCPNAEGQVTLTVKLSSKGHAGKNGAITYDRNLAVTVTAQVGQDARIASEHYQVTSAEKDRPNAELLGRGALSAAESHWKYGKCIKINAASPGTVKPGATSKIPVSVTHRLDGSAIPAKVTVELSGGATVTPSVIPNAPGEVTHVAVDKEAITMTITLTATSRRGKATADLKIETKAQSYFIEGGADEFQGEGYACDFSKPFTLTGSGVTVKFEPASNKGGKYTYSGNMSGFSVSGHGTYTVAYQGNIPTHMTARGPGSVETALGTPSADGTEEYSITPVTGDSCN